MTRRLYSIRELAEALGVNPTTVSKRITRRGLTPVRVEGKAKLFRASAIEALKPLPVGWPRGKARRPPSD